MNPSAAATSQKTRPARWIEPLLADIPADWGTPSIVSRILWKRGLRTAAEVRKFMDPSLDDLHNPLLMAGMSDAVARLGRAINDQEKVLLYGDYDVDGTTSIVILKTALRLAGLDADFHVPHRLKDGYGMHPEVIDRAAANGVKLIISVDTGIRADYQRGYRYPRIRCGEAGQCVGDRLHCYRSSLAGRRITTCNRSVKSQSPGLQISGKEFVRGWSYAETDSGFA